MYYLLIAHKPSGVLYLLPFISSTYLPDRLLLFLSSL